MYITSYFLDAKTWFLIVHGTKCMIVVLHKLIEKVINNYMNDWYLSYVAIRLKPQL